MDADHGKQHKVADLEIALIREQIWRMKDRLKVLEDEQREINRKLDAFVASLEGVIEP